MRGILKLGVAAVALAVGVLGARTSYALIDDPFTSYTQPANALIMPFDATTGHQTFLLVSNVAGISPSGIGGVSTHWSFWSDACDHLGDVDICLTLNDTVVVDPTKIQAIDAGNNGIGPIINLSGDRGFLTVTAFATDETCGDPSIEGFTLVDDAIVGTYTFASTVTGASSGNDAIGLGTDPTNSFTDLPDFLLSPTSTSGFLDLQTFNPETLDNSIVVLIGVKENAGKLAGEVGPVTSNITANANFVDNTEVSTSLPDVKFSCALFSSLIPGATNLIPSTVSVLSSGIYRMTNIQNGSKPVGGSASGGNDTFVYGVHGQAVGQFGGSSNAKYSVL